MRLCWALSRWQARKWSSGAPSASVQAPLLPSRRVHCHAVLFLHGCCGRCPCVVVCTGMTHAHTHICTRSQVVSQARALPLGRAITGSNAVHVQLLDRHGNVCGGVSDLPELQCNDADLTKLKVSCLCRFLSAAMPWCCCRLDGDSFTNSSPTHLSQSQITVKFAVHKSLRPQHATHHLRFFFVPHGQRCTKCETFTCCGQPFLAHTCCCTDAVGLGAAHDRRVTRGDGLSLCRRRRPTHNNSTRPIPVTCSHDLSRSSLPGCLN